MFTQAIVRPPGANFAEGLTTANLGLPDYYLALRQHDQYCQTLEQCGLRLTRLEPDLRYPDSTFVEDVAILAERCVILTRPGAASRAGEVTAMAGVLDRFSAGVQTITEPGTLDGGDVCEAGEHFFIGVSQRTNEEGARQLAALLTQAGYGSSLIDIRSVAGILHLKSGLACLGDGRLVVIDALAGQPAWRGYEIVHVAPGEEYAANCLRVNDQILLAAGFPILEKTIRRLGYQVKLLSMSEFQKMDGGLSCLSLRL